MCMLVHCLSLATCAGKDRRIPVASEQIAINEGISLTCCTVCKCNINKKTRAETTISEHEVVEQTRRSSTVGTLLEI